MSTMQRIRIADSTALSMPGLVRPDAEWVGIRKAQHDAWAKSFLGSYDSRRKAFTTDNFMTFDRASQWTIDSTGAFLIGELERLDQKLHDPLVAVTWGRDIDLREDVTMGDEFSSFTLSSFASPGGITPTGKAWIGKNSNAIPGVELDIGKVVNPLLPWGLELKWTLMELESASKVGRPIDSQKYDGMKMKYQMDIDQMVYTGDTDYGKFGLFNNPLVTPSNVAAGVGGTTWALKTPDEILKDVNEVLTTAWVNSGMAIVPTELRVPPLHFSMLASSKVSTAGNISTLEFLRNNSLTNASYGRPLNIQPVKWLTANSGVTSVNRMVAYTKDKDRVRYPLVPLQHTPVEYRSIYQITTYFGKLGVVEVVYPETIAYRDGI